MDFLQILTDQKEEMDALPWGSYCPRIRQYDLDLTSSLAQVVVGMRRSGKTTLCHQALRAAGAHYAYINFDDEILANLSAAPQLNDLLLAAYAVYGDFTHIFLDEIQNIDGWELFVNRLLRRGLRVVLTGSNSHLLSQELGTHLTGRYREIELLPLSFAEYLSFAKIDDGSQSTRALARREEAYQTYSRQGGLPESYQVADRRSYLNTLYNAILFKDVTRRFNVRYPKVLAQFSSVLLDNFCREVNYLEISKMLGVKGTHTLQNYASHLEQAFLIRLVPKFSFKPLRRQQSEKAYAMDLGMVTSFTGISENGDNLGWRLENLVFLKLYSGRAAGDYDIFYWKNGCEVDFVLVRKQRVLQLIQVCYDLSTPKTRQREINALLKASEQLFCNDLLLITHVEKATEKHNGKTIRLLPVTDFLLKPLVAESPNT
ncbi:MAG: ATP-binding protein [Victivallales bacterium]|nr:ATP-binding protein [Victivallales bacterium]